MAIDKIDRIKKVSGKIQPQALEPNKDYFEALMRQKEVKTEPAITEASELPKKIRSLFDEAREISQKPEYASRSKPIELVAQTEDIVAQIDVLKTKLETPDLEIKNSVQTILRNKLTHIDDSLKVALEKAGVEYVVPEKSDGMSKPIDRFLGMLSDSQNQLETLASDVRLLTEKGEELSPANMLLIQIKVGQIQQEIELFTSMLNKALESTKTLMNVQV